MNAVKKLVVSVLSLGLFAPIAVFAATPEQTYLATVRNDDPNAPVAVKVVAPQGYDALPGDTAEIAFVVDASGRPTDVSVRLSTEKTLADAAVAAVKEWRFTPVKRDGQPVAAKVILPFRVVAGGSVAAN
jgi:TonB family protein